ncbi:RNA polymerase primary sigma factor [Nonomuraea thailandensis]|uniref:RNA polymerase primary sigma factor n=1 Tax=Nonomuraea thailandensis TaxID=1188745 RepID=A0A9X2GS74_9ACTN|nr:helix-turn-helix domain-containing protein [Nonomuraea thailandensis]MCP2364191.1 RNA polymerase primary sigma factor [Nonomuraea thailandensis]
MSLGERLDQELQRQGKTQVALAEAVGVSPATVSQWRAGSKKPSVANVIKIGEWLSISPAWLQFGDDPAPSRPVNEKDRAAYQRDCIWYYRSAPNDQGRELGSAAGFVFEGGIPTLARETGQNILDERKDGEPAVRATYTVMELSGPQLDSFLATIKFDEVRHHLEAASQSRQKVATVIRKGLETLDADQRLVLLKIEDFGANGLVGPEYDNGRYMAVVRNILDSFKDENAGGSYGLGKSVMWACSQFGLVLINSTLSVSQDGRREGRFIARMELPWHRLDKDYAGPAWYGEWDPEKECTRSYWGNPALAADALLDRPDGQSGTSFLIVGAYDPSGESTTVEEMHDSLCRALADNFWPAMTEPGEGEQAPMVALVRSERNGRILREDVVDPAAYHPAKVAMLRVHFDELTVDTLEAPGDVVRRSIPLNLPRRTAEGAHDHLQHEAVLLVAEADEESAEINRVAYTRGSQMIIREVPVRPLSMGSRPFHAVVLAGLGAGAEPADRAAERFLRAAEPPEHNHWVVTPDLSRSYSIGYHKALSDFYAEVGKTIREIVGRPNRDLSDGPDALKELLRITPPSEATTRRLRVKTAMGNLDDEGRWIVEATVTLPPRKEPWRFSPTIRFGTETGSGISVMWESLTGLSCCAADGDVIVAETGARSVRFRAVTDASTHPVNARWARVLVDVRVYKGSTS